MTSLRRKVYLTAGYNTISLGTGRSEFNPRKPRPGLEHYIKEAAEGTLSKIGGGKNVDESVIGNFIAARFNKQAHLNAMMPMVDDNLRFKPATSVEGACASGGLALLTAMKSVLAETADVVLALGVEVQNSVKAIYGADYLAAAGWFQDRKKGHAYFFPGQFSDRADAYFQKYGKDKTREAMAKWFENAIENARLCPTAQEYQNNSKDLKGLGMTEPNAKYFTPCLNIFDCSKVSDGASAIALISEEGLKKIGVPKDQTVEIVGWGHAMEDITKPPTDPTKLTTMEQAISQALKSANISVDQLGTIETHDCFSIAGILSIEALGLAKPGEGKDFVLAGKTSRDGEIPFNTTGGLIGWGHPTGATGVHMAVTIWEQLTGNAGEAQIKMNDSKPYGMSINMGGDDKTLVCIIYKKAD
ncbi:MAG: hypothetical protein KAS71_04335 [Bacteroidales bacterium]|nr:hypothetical protein [Bacteroidales bacterium]